MSEEDFKIRSSLKPIDNSHTIHQQETDFRKTIEERIKELASKNISFILFEIFEKNAEGNWQRTQVLVEKRQAEMYRQHNKSNEKADQYRSSGNVCSVSAETFASLLGTCLGGSVGGFLTAAGQGLSHSRKLLVEDRRAISVTLIDNHLQRSNNFLGDATNSLQNAENNIQKAQDRQLQKIQNERELFRAILGS